MKVDDYFAAGSEPPLLSLLLETVDDEEVFPHGAADKLEKPAELAKTPDGKIYVKSEAVTREASPEQLRAFQEACRQAMRDLFNFALFCWTDKIDSRFVEFARTIEVGTALIERHAAVLYPLEFEIRQAITGTAGRKDLTEEDAVPFLYYMMGVFVASREEWYWQKEMTRTGTEKPWQRM